MSRSPVRQAPRLYIITDHRATGGRPLLEVLTTLLADLQAAIPKDEWAGAVAIQLRAKHLPTRALLTEAQSLRALTRSRGCRLFVNERLDIALAVGADGVHLPERGLDIASARVLAGPKMAIGASTHSPEGAARAARAGADLVLLSPVWATVKSTPQGPPLGLGALTQAARLMAERAERLIALGGVTDPARAGQAIAAGASGIAGIRLFMDDPAKADLSRLWSSVTARALKRPARLHSRDELG